MKNESETSAEELIQLRIRHQSVKTRNQILTEQVTRYVQRSRDLEHELCNTQQEILQLREQLSLEDNESNTVSNFANPVLINDFNNPSPSINSLPMTLNSSVLSSVAAPSTTRSALLGTNGLCNRPIIEGHLIQTGATVHHAVLDAQSSTPGLSTLAGTTSFGCFSDSNWLAFPYSSLPVSPSFDASFSHPVMLAPSLSPPSTLAVSPRLHQSTAFGALGHEVLTEGPSSMYRSLENVMEAPEDATANIDDDPNSLTLSELFADEIEQMTERRVKRFRK
eukprot:g5837.t1